MDRSFPGTRENKLELIIQINFIKVAIFHFVLKNKELGWVGNLAGKFPPLLILQALTNACIWGFELLKGKLVVVLKIA